MEKIWNETEIKELILYAKSLQEENEDLRAKMIMMNSKLELEEKKVTRLTNILKALLIAGITVGISSRAMGSVKQIGETVEVQDDLELVCWDFVSTPSTQGAFMEIVNESLNPNTVKTDKYQKINELITEILCNRAGFCTCELPGQ